jgi:hypothetical protein
MMPMLRYVLLSEFVSCHPAIQEQPFPPQSSLTRKSTPFIDFLNTAPCPMSMAVVVLFSYDALSAKISLIKTSKTNAEVFDFDMFSISNYFLI